MFFLFFFITVVTVAEPFCNMKLDTCVIAILFYVKQ